MSAMASSWGRRPDRRLLQIPEHAIPSIREVSGFWAEELRRKIIQDRLALRGEESVSVGHRRHPPPGQIGETHMRIYIIGNDGITLSREAPATVTEGEIAVTSNRCSRRERRGRFSSAAARFSG